MNSPAVLLEHLSCVQLTGQLLHAVITLLEVQAPDVKRAFQAVAPGKDPGLQLQTKNATSRLFRKPDPLRATVAGAGGLWSQAGVHDEDRITDKQAQITALVVGRFGVRSVPQQARASTSIIRFC